MLKSFATLIYFFYRKPKKRVKLCTRDINDFWWMRYLYDIIFSIKSWNLIFFININKLINKKDIWNVLYTNFKIHNWKNNYTTKGFYGPICFHK